MRPTIPVMRYAAVAALLAGCDVTAPGGAPMDGEWGVSGDGPCAFYALATLSGDSHDFRGSAVLERGNTPETVAVTGRAAAVDLGPLRLTVEARHMDQPGPSLSGSFTCGGAPGTWAMFRYQ